MSNIQIWTILPTWGRLSILLYIVGHRNGYLSPTDSTVSITVSHGSAYTVVRAIEQVNGKWQFLGVRTL